MYLGLLLMNLFFLQIQQNKGHSKEGLYGEPLRRNPAQGCRYNPLFKKRL